MAKFSQNFTLRDIFENSKLKNKIPLIKYKEGTTPKGKESVRTQVKSVGTVVYNTSISAGRPFFRPITHSKNGDKINIGGNLVGDIDEAVDAIYNAIKGKKDILSYTANNAYMIRDALKEAERNKKKGIESKLYLRANSMAQIEGMTKKEVYALLKDVMDNIFFGDNFPETQKKYGVKDLLNKTNGLSYYDQEKQKWKKRVGDL